MDTFLSDLGLTEALAALAVLALGVLIYIARRAAQLAKAYADMLFDKAEARLGIDIAADQRATVHSAIDSGIGIALDKLGVSLADALGKDRTRVLNEAAGWARMLGAKDSVAAMEARGDLTPQGMLDLAADKLRKRAERAGLAAPS